MRHGDAFCPIRVWNAHQRTSWKVEPLTFPVTATTTAGRCAGSCWSRGSPPMSRVPPDLVSARPHREYSSSESVYRSPACLRRCRWECEGPSPMALTGWGGLGALGASPGLLRHTALSRVTSRCYAIAAALGRSFRASAAWADGGAAKSRRDHRGRLGSVASVAHGGRRASARSGPVRGQEPSRRAAGRCR